MTEAAKNKEGDFPILIAVSVVNDATVTLSFSTPVEEFDMTPAQARAFAASILQKASTIEGTIKDGVH